MDIMNMLLEEKENMILTNIIVFKKEKEKDMNWMMHKYQHQYHYYFCVWLVLTQQFKRHFFNITISGDIATIPNIIANTMKSILSMLIDEYATFWLNNYGVCMTYSNNSDLYAAKISNSKTISKYGIDIESHTIFGSISGALYLALSMNNYFDNNTSISPQVISNMTYFLLDFSLSDNALEIYKQKIDMLGEEDNGELVKLKVSAREQVGEVEHLTFMDTIKLQYNM